MQMLVNLPYTCDLHIIQEEVLDRSDGEVLGGMGCPERPLFRSMAKQVRSDMKRVLPGGGGGGVCSLR